MSHFICGSELFYSKNLPYFESIMFVGPPTSVPSSKSIDATTMHLVLVYFGFTLVLGYFEALRRMIFRWV